ncbi:RimJ/RimL family protein N-acetyltransferase [Allocatelliglobosispora scoriae]|uniref:RimJ/RimL family protein N-acetyltransferase n=1 Tax=Allocatelliglobosispora scoriae TaxID=643052 RepID=A0A841BGI3_9ACTN|nr:GNAT family protein [Allocatelliglobosispora scoriae]MBB5868197.1 RimJ/RimL family protein N-acetyltransferase [Allocatelliglobosispora scoriae]
MLRGDKVGLRARHAEDVPILHEGLQDDVYTRLRADTRPWLPMSLQESPYAPRPSKESVICFSVVSLADGSLAGEALLWGIDTHNRFSHIGISMLPQSRGKGFATDTVRVLCQYGFMVLGLQRMQLETLSDNHAMRQAALSAGFTVEGTLRRTAWVNGEFVDDVIFGLLRDEWSGGPIPPTAS